MTVRSVNLAVLREIRPQVQTGTGAQDHFRIHQCILYNYYVHVQSPMIPTAFRAPSAGLQHYASIQYRPFSSSLDPSPPPPSPSSFYSIIAFAYMPPSPSSHFTPFLHSLPCYWACGSCVLANSKIEKFNTNETEETNHDACMLHKQESCFHTFLV